MKNRFSTVDVFATVHDLKALQGLRVTNVYDIDSKTYLIRMHIPDEKCFIMFESGMRLHRTAYEWPKAQFPSSFSMKLRKHIRQKRLERVQQLGLDRIVDLQFGSDERAIHVLVELYDRGNIILTDHQYIILNILRARTDKDLDVRFSVRERYPIENARDQVLLPSKQQLAEMLSLSHESHGKHGEPHGKHGESLRRSLATLTQYGPALIEHALRMVNIPSNAKIGINIENSEEDIEKLLNAMKIAHEIFDEIRAHPSHGYITFKQDTRVDGVSFESYQEFHPYRFKQFESGEIGFREFPTFWESVDEFFSKIESQKADQRALNAEREALKKLENVKRDQKERIESLEMAQTAKKELAELIELNSGLVDKALLIIRSAIANQLSWETIEEMRIKACEVGDPVASSIVGLNLNSNEMILQLRDPYHADSAPKKVPIDISLSAYQNSRKFHTEKKAAVDKKQKTISASTKALKSAQLKTKQTLDTVRAKADVVKSRRHMWFEKFFWFVTSENYLVIGGRDAQQNELLVKRYLRAGDIYVHADVRGASSVIIRNKLNGGEIPPKTLNEAGSMAVCYSSAWDAKVIASAWWVYHHQVSRNAPTGEYLTSGSFMIRGKKNFLPSCQLQMGFGIMFKLDEDSVVRHLGERIHTLAASTEESDITLATTLQNTDEMELEDDEVELESSESDADADGQEDDQQQQRHGSGFEAEPEPEEQFPDVQVSLSGIVKSTSSGTNDEDEEYTIIQLGPTVPTTVTDRNQHEREKLMEENRKKKEMSSIKKPGNRPMTIRQKHKAEKIKKKYADQNEEEGDVRAKWLGAAMAKDEQEQEIESDLSQMDAKKRDNERILSKNQEEQGDMHNAEKVMKPEDDDQIDETDLRTMGEEETKMLDSLTWKPLPEDNLLYAIVVVAPYHTMLNFKYKVKLTPGTGKRGKAAKSAIALFQRDKSASAQELNLLRVLATDDQISRNIPGKVRVSAPQLHKK